MIVVIFTIIFVSLLGCFISSYCHLKNRYSEARSNIKAYEQLYDSAVNQNRRFELTIDELNYSRDSLVQALNKIRKENKILDKKIKSLSYVSSVVEIHDTVKLRDTLSIREGVSIDTALVSPWYNINFLISPPDSLIFSIKVPSEKYIIASTNRETIDPPKKCFIARLFQKKHTVVDVQIIEKNPYIVNKQSRFIEVVK